MRAAAATCAATRFARRRGLAGAPELLRSGANAVFRVEDVVLRVSPAGVDASAHVALARWLAEQGLPVLRPLADAETINGMSVTSWEHIDSDAPAIDYRQYGQAIARVHRLDPARVGDYADLDWCGAAAWLQLGENLERAAASKVVTDADIELLRIETHALAGWQDAARREPHVVCHGDVHPQNILTRGDQLVILDWDAICLGPTAWDHAALLTWAERWGGQRDVYSAFATGYGADLSTSPLAQTLARVRLLAPTINMIIAGNSSTHYAQEAQVRMRYWRGEPHPPAWTPQ